MTLSLAAQAASIFALMWCVARLAPAARSALVAGWLGVLLLPVIGPLLAAGPLRPVGGLPAPLAGADPLALQALTAAAPGLQEPAVAPVISGLAALWWAGLAVGGLGLLASVLRAARLRTGAQPREPGVAITDRVDVPVVVGVLRPVILLPTASDAWSPERRLQVLAHERAHIAGWDNLWLLVAQGVARIHWFNPLAWAAVGALRTACEHRADAAVLRAGVAPTDYAETLIALSRGRPPATAMAMSRSRLEHRVLRILDGRAGTGRIPLAVVLAGLSGAALAGTSPPPLSLDTTDAVLEAQADAIVREHAPEGVVLVALDARTGEELGRASRGDLDGQRVAHGSVLKPFVAAAAVELGLGPEERFEGGSLTRLLATSSNRGMLDVADRIGLARVRDVFGRVGLPATAPLDTLTLGGEPTTHDALAQAWRHLAGHGAVDPAVAATVRDMLVHVVEDEDGTGQRAAVPGVQIAGKTGTAPLLLPSGEADSARMLASFVGLVPADDPQLVLLVSVAAPQGDAVWGGVVAAPAFAEIVRALR